MQSVSFWIVFRRDSAVHGSPPKIMCVVRVLIHFGDSPSLFVVEGYPYGTTTQSSTRTVTFSLWVHYYDTEKEPMSDSLDFMG